MPTYPFSCLNCGVDQDVLCPIAERDKNYLCTSCSGDLVRQVCAPVVMQHALPDGTKRFHDLRTEIALDRAKKWNPNKADVAKLDKEIKKIHKGAA